MVKVKICGLTRSEDLQQVILQGADYAGFIFYPPSPRYVKPEQVAEMESSSIQRVGVFVNEAPSNVREIFELARLDLVQLHGEESPEYCAKLNLPYWKAIRVKDSSSLDALDHYSPDNFILDTFSPNLYGGTGKTFNLDLAKQALTKTPRIIIAGGVAVDNLHEILSLQPFGIDVSSSLEENPGRKSPEKLKLFFNRLNQLRTES